jgi:hypothetical protein
MENIINIHIEKLPDGIYLATSEDVPGLVAQDRTVTEALEHEMWPGSSLKHAENVHGVLNW